jgi:F0F1-type ATP synthase assembly protein I
MKNQIIRTLVLQYILGVVYLTGAGLWDTAVMLSALVGCLAALVPGTYFGVRMMQATENNNDAAQWLGYAYRYEIGKWVMMGMIFILAFTSGYSWDPVVLFAGFVLIQLSGWLAPLMGNAVNNKR